MMRYSPGQNAYVEAPDSVDVPDELYAVLIGYEIEPGLNGLPRKTAAAVREALLASVTQKRWEVETSGITLPNGIQIDTGREDQAAVANAIAVWPFTGLATISFKAASGFVTLDFESLKTIAAAIGLHKQACYAAERTHFQAIALLLDAALATYDIGTGWPSGQLTLAQMEQINGQFLG